MGYESFRRWLAPILVTAILLVVLLLFFPFSSGYLAITRPLGSYLWSMWTTVSPGSRDYTYCPFAPVLGAYLIFTNRSQLSRAPLRGNTAAICWIILGLLLFWDCFFSGSVPGPPNIYPLKPAYSFFCWELSSGFGVARYFAFSPSPGSS